MRNFCLPVLLVLAALISFLSCSIKEDRDLCPCTLALDIKTTADSLPDVIVLLSGGNGVEAADTFALEGETTTVLVKSPRSPSAVVSAVCPASIPFDSHGNVFITEGDECPEIWMDQDVIDARSEYVRDTLTLHKNWCGLTIRINPGVKGEYPFLVRLRGDVCGYSAGMQPLDGAFSVERKPEEGVCRIAVPRQKNSSMMLDIVDSKDILRSFAIGEYLADSGYDWDSPDLVDASVSVDLSETSVSLTVDLWGAGKTYEIVI